MTFSEFSKFSESLQNRRAVWLPETFYNSQWIHSLPCNGKKNCPLLPVVWYLFRVVSSNRCLPKGSNENAFNINTTSNVFVARSVISLVNIPLLDLVTIHSIN